MQELSKAFLGEYVFVPSSSMGERKGLSVQYQEVLAEVISQSHRDALGNAETHLNLPPPSVLSGAQIGA